MSAIQREHFRQPHSRHGLLSSKAKMLCRQCQRQVEAVTDFFTSKDPMDGIVQLACEHRRRESNPSGLTAGAPVVPLFFEKDADAKSESKAAA